jgi:hypothetical protein
MSSEKKKMLKAHNKKEKVSRRDKSKVNQDQEGHDFGQIDLANEFEQHVQVEQGSEMLTSSNQDGSPEENPSDADPIPEKEEGEEEDEGRELQDEDYDPLLDQYGDDPSEDEESEDE